MTLAPPLLYTLCKFLRSSNSNLLYFNFLLVWILIFKLFFALFQTTFKMYS